MSIVLKRRRQLILLQMLQLRLSRRIIFVPRPRKLSRGRIRSPDNTRIVFRNYSSSFPSLPFSSPDDARIVSGSISFLIVRRRRRVRMRRKGRKVVWRKHRVGP